MRLSVGGLTLGFGLVAALAGCGGGESSPATVEAPLVGDWFVCADAACANLDNNGWRLEPDGTARSLDGSDGPAVEPVCTDFGADVWSYRYEGGMLTLGEIHVRAELAQDVLTLYEVPVLTGDGPMGTETVRAAPE